MPNPSSFFRAVAARLSRVPPRLPPSAAARPPDCSVGRGGSLLRAGCAGLRASRGGDEMRTGVAAHPRVGLLTAPAAGWRSAARLAAPAEERLAGRGAGAGAGAGGCTVGAGRTVGVAAERRLPQASQSAPPPPPPPPPPPGCRRCGALLRCCCVLPPPREDCDESQEPPNAPSSSPQTSSGSMPGGLQQPPPGSNRTCSTVAVASRRVSAGSSEYSVSPTMREEFAPRPSLASSRVSCPMNQSVGCSCSFYSASPALAALALGVHEPEA
jgi:hypothetical protein